MVLGVRVVKARFLIEALQAVLATAGSGFVIIIWCPEFLGLQSVFPVTTMPEGENTTTLIKIPPQSFSYYDSLDDHFNAVVRVADLEEVFHTAIDSDYIELSQISQRNNGLNEHGYLNANFNRRDKTIRGKWRRGAYLNFYFPMKIYGILPEGVVRATDPSAIPLTPVATFRANDLAKCLPTLKNLGFDVLVNAYEKEVRFFKKESSLDPLVVTQLNGLISTGEDCKFQPITFYMHCWEFMPAAALSDEVSLFKLSEKAVMIWFRLAHLKGDIIQCLY